MDEQKIAKGIQLILEGIGEDPQREGLQRTPERVAKMYGEILGGTHLQPELDAGFSEEIGDDMILLREIPFYSMCEHHLLPFFGKVHVAYIPRENRVAGFSSITRLVDIYAHRLQLQERLTGQIAEAIMKNLRPQGTLVVVEAQQLCVSMRGSKKDSVRTVTQAVRGDIAMDRVQLNEMFITRR